MRLWRCAVYIILLPLSPIFVCLLIMFGQVETSATIEEVLGGTELFFTALVVICMTLRDVESVTDEYKMGGRFDLVRPVLLLATCFVSMSACFAFIHDRVFDFGLDQRVLAACGVGAMLLASALCITAQSKLAMFRLANAPSDKPKRLASVLD